MINAPRQTATEISEAARDISIELSRWKEEILQSVMDEDPSLGPHNVELYCSQNEMRELGQQRFDLEVVRTADRSVVTRSTRFVEIRSIYDEGRPVKDHVMELVSVDELKRLREDAAWLDCLEAAGVDNWDGYCHAQEIKEMTYGE